MPFFKSKIKSILLHRSITKMYYYSNNIPIQVQPFWYDTTYMPLTFGYYAPESSRQTMVKIQNDSQQNLEVKLEEKLEVKLEVKLEKEESPLPKLHNIVKRQKVKQFDRTSSYNEYSPQAVKIKPKKKYKRKNNQTNIINQIFSFLCYEKKSESACAKILGNDRKKIQIFYAFMRSLKKNRAKYLNLSYLKILLTFPQKSPQWRIIQRSKKKKELFTMEQFKMTIYKLTYFFLRTQCHLYVILSKRLSDISVQSHLHKRRQILRVLTQHFSKVFDYNPVKLQANEQPQQQEKCHSLQGENLIP